MQQLLRQFALYHYLEAALRNQLLAAVWEKYFAAMILPTNKELLGIGGVPIKSVKDQCGFMSGKDIVVNRGKLRAGDIADMFKKVNNIVHMENLQGPTTKYWMP